MTDNGGCLCASRHSMRMLQASPSIVDMVFLYSVNCSCVLSWCKSARQAGVRSSTSKSRSKGGRLRPIAPPVPPPSLPTFPSTFHRSWSMSKPSQPASSVLSILPRRQHTAQAQARIRIRTHITPTALPRQHLGNVYTYLSLTTRRFN